jgi:hypothetical protein
MTEHSIIRSVVWVGIAGLLLGGCTTTGVGKDMPVAADNADMKRAAMIMLAEAKKVSAGLNILAKTRRGGMGTEFLHMRQDWARRIVEAALKLTDAPKQRIGAIRRHVASRKTDLKMLTSRRNLDAGIIQIAMGQYALAEAQYLLAGVLERCGPVKEKNNAKIAGTRAARDMQTNAKKVLKGFELLAKFRRDGVDPEFVMMQQIWNRRSMEARLKLTNEPKQRVAVVRRYVAACDAGLKAINARRKLDTTYVHVAMAKYSLAEAKYLLAGIDEQSSPKSTTSPPDHDDKRSK